MEAQCGATRLPHEAGWAFPNLTYIGSPTGKGKGKCRRQGEKKAKPVIAAVRTCGSSDSPPG